MSEAHQHDDVEVGADVSAVADELQVPEQPASSAPRVRFLDVVPLPPAKRRNFKGRVIALR